MTRETQFGVTYDLSDTTALEDAEFTSSSNSSFADLTNLQTGQKSAKIITLAEPNLIALDGTWIAQGTNTATGDVAYFSSDYSDENGEFSTNPTIDIAFNEYHSSFALTIGFLPDYPLQMRVVWYRDSSILYDNTYDVDSLTYVISQDVQVYNRIVLEFVKTRPYRYVKIDSIKFGVVLNWDETNIKSGRLVQELNRVGDKLSINTLSFEVIDVSNNLNFGNTSGMHNYYQRHQVIQPYEIIDGETIDLGKFYLDKFSTENNLGKMSAVSAVGLLDEVQFDEGQVYNGTLAKTVIDKIFEVAEIDDYEIDSVTANQKLYGTIAPKTCREALREVLFACHSIIDSTEEDKIKIAKQSEVILAPITRATKFSTRATSTTYISDIQVKYNLYTLNSQAEEILSDIYNAGKYRVMLDAPYTNFVISGGTIVKSSTYYVIFRVANDNTTVSIVGMKYEYVTNAIKRSRPYIDPGKVKYIKTFTTTLCNEETATELIDSLFEYYTNSTIQANVKHLATEISMNNNRLVENPIQGLRDYLGIFTKRTFDLTGGFIDTAELVGYFNLQDDYMFAGEGLYGNDNFLI